MIFELSRNSERKKGQNTLAYLMQHRSKVRLIHYACESFSNSKNRAPRITSISVYDMDSLLIESFSIHLSAQEKGLSNLDLNESNIDSIEKDLLRKYFLYVKENKSCKWVHWKMKDQTYGFKAIELRYKILKGKPLRVHNENKYDLSEILKLVYSYKYETNDDKGKLICLARRNGFKLKKALTGIEEAKAFDDKEYHLLHHSTQQKVEGLAFILQKAGQDKLKVAANIFHINGLSWKLLKSRYLWSFIGIIGTIIFKEFITVTIKTIFQHYSIEALILSLLGLK